MGSICWFKSLKIGQTVSDNKNSNFFFRGNLSTLKFTFWENVFRWTYRLLYDLYLKNQVDTLILRSNIGANVKDAETASFLCFCLNLLASMSASWVNNGESFRPSAVVQSLYSLSNIFFLNIFLGDFFLFVQYNIQHCFICRPSDSTVPTDAGIEPRTVATSALAVRRSNH